MSELFSDRFVRVLLEQYAANSGNDFRNHFNQNAALHWMRDALEDARVCSQHSQQDVCRVCGPRLAAALARVGAA